MRYIDLLYLFQTQNLFNTATFNSFVYFFQSHRRGGFHHHIHHHERPQTPQFYSPYEPFAPPRGPHHTAHVPPTPYTDALDFRDSRFVNIPKDLRDQRLLADRDEHLIIAQANEEEKGDHLTHGPNSLLGFGPPQVAPHTPHVTPQHASSFPSFEAAIQEHFGRFGPKRPSPHQPVHHYQEPLLYSPVPIPPNRGFRPPSSGGIIHNKNPFAGAHHHHHQVPPPAPYTSTPIQFPSIRHSTKSSKAIRFPSKKRRHDFFNTPRKVPIANYFNEF